MSEYVTIVSPGGKLKGRLVGNRDVELPGITRPETQMHSMFRLDVDI